MNKDNKQRTNQTTADSNENRDPRRLKREQQKKLKRDYKEATTTPSERTQVDVHVRNITNWESEETKSFIAFLGQKNRGGTLDVFKSDPRINIKVELLREEPDTPDSNAIGLAVHIPIYSDGHSDEHTLKIIKDVIRSAEAEKKKLNGQTKIDRAFMQRIIDRKLSPVETAVEIPVIPLTSPARSRQENDHHFIVLDKINGRSLTDFASYMLNNNRITALRAFSEKKDLGFTVAVQDKKDAGPCFVISLPKGQDGQIDEITLNLARLAIGKLRAEQENSTAIKLEFVRTFLDKFIKEQKEASKHRLGDNIVALFGDLSRNKKIPMPLRPVVITEGTNVDHPIPLATEFNNFVCPVDFRLPPFDENGRMQHLQPNGVPKIFEPTKNQWALIDAIRNPDIKTVLCQAPTGAGKTFWSIYVALELLQQGIVKEVAYERPITTVGDHYSAYLKGGLDDKFGPYADVVEAVFAEHLGGGDAKAGMKTLQELKKSGVLDRYDQLFRAGDNLKFKLVIADEAQNKDRAEIFHLITRPAEGGKMVLVGDGIDQDYLYKRKSGFLQAIELFSNAALLSKAKEELRKTGMEINPGSVAIVRMGPEDIRRDPHTAFVYQMYKLLDALDSTKETKSPTVQNQPRHKPPSQ